MTVGRIIQGRYRLLSKLGQGGMGEVWRGEHIGLGTPVAVKLLNPAVLDSKTAASRFKREAQAAASLRGTNVVQLLDYGVDDDSPYIVMELLEGESLATRLSRMAPLSPRETVLLLGQVGKAVARAHGLSIVHRDLKPDNIFIVRDGEEEVAKVLDFGIAKTLSKEGFQLSIQTTSGAILGTPHYMSPEQASGRAAVDHRSDIWSFGVIAFECLTGYRPFNGSTLGGLVIAICSDPIPTPSSLGSVPRRFDDWFLRCVAREPAQRFQNMLEAVTALRLICDPPGNFSAISLEGEARELTLQASVRAPVLDSGRADRTPAVEPSETVSASSRTVGMARRRRLSTNVYVAVAAVFVGVCGGVLGLHAVLERTQPKTSESTAAVAPPEPKSFVSAATVAPPTPSSAMPLAVAASASAGPPMGNESQGVLALPVAAPNSAPPSRERQTGKSIQASRAKGVAQAADAPAKDAGLLKPPPSAEPANRPESQPIDTEAAARRRNIEDRLAF